MMHFRKKTLEK